MNLLDRGNVAVQVLRDLLGSIAGAAFVKTSTGQTVEDAIGERMAGANNLAEVVDAATAQANIDLVNVPGVPTVAGAITAAAGRRISGPPPATLVDAGLTIADPLGADFDDNMRVMVGGVLYNSYANRPMVFGAEYLHALREKQRTYGPIVLTFTGDSTTAGSGLTLSSFQIHSLVSVCAAQDQYQNVTGVNRGLGGEHVGNWGAGALRVVGDLATNPDVLIVRWGINDPFYGRTIQQFAADLRAGLATCRATRPVSNLSIVLMSPNSTSDTPNGRDELWYEQVNRVVRCAARDYQCCFIDTYGMFQGSRGAAGLWMDDPFGDGRAIHPLESFNLSIASAIYDVLFPRLVGTFFARPKFVAPTLLNGWVDFSPQTASGYFKDRNQFVNLRGVIKSGTIANTTVLFTLPPNFRPFTDQFFMANSNNAPAGITVKSTGDVIIQFGANATYLALDGIRFALSNQ